MNESQIDRCLSKLDKIEYVLDLLIDENRKLQEENQNFLDTFQAIYDKLGLTEKNVNGKELVSDTVKCRVDEIIEAYENLKTRFETEYYERY